MFWKCTNHIKIFLQNQIWNHHLQNSFLNEGGCAVTFRRFRGYFCQGLPEKSLTHPVQQSGQGCGVELNCALLQCRTVTQIGTMIDCTFNDGLKKGSTWWRTQIILPPVKTRHIWRSEFPLSKLCMDICWSDWQWVSRLLASKVPVAGTLTMNKDEILKTIYWRLLVEDATAVESTWSKMLEFGIKCGSRKEGERD